MNERPDPHDLRAASRQASASTLLFDNSLSILNRTGAYHIAKDLIGEFVPGQAKVRYWRLGSFAPEGLAVCPRKNSRAPGPILDAGNSCSNRAV